MSKKSTKALARRMSDSDKPVAPSVPIPPKQHYPIDETRELVFLEALAKTGSMRAAAEAATPWSSDGGGLQQFKRHMRVNEHFGDRVEQAKAAALAKVEEIAMDVAINPSEKPIIWQKTGETVAVEKRYDTKHIQFMLSRMDPEKWGSRATVKHKHEGTVGIMVVPGVSQTDDEWEQSIEDADLVEEPEKQDRNDEIKP